MRLKMHSGSPGRPHGEPGRSAGLTAKGLSLIEVIIILAVLATLIALLVPSTVQQLTAARRDSTLDEMEALQRALIGDPDLIAQGVRTDFGYLGDMGNLPADLDDLVVQGAQPAFGFDSTMKIGAGWKGPYFTLRPGSDLSSHERDAFGNDYVYDDTDYVNGDGQEVDAVLVSLGADAFSGGTGVDEDVTLEILKSVTFATLGGFVFDASANPMEGAEVAVHYPAGGTLASITATTDEDGFFQVDDVPFGIRSVTLEPALTLVPGSVLVFGGSGQHIEFRVANHSNAAITVRFLTAAYTPVSSPAFYDQVRWGGTTAYNCSGGFPAGSGTTVAFSSDQAVAAGPGVPPVSVVAAASFVQVTDITIQGSGTEATLQLREFRTGGASCSSGSLVNISGANFSDVTLRDPSNNIVAQFSFTVP